jgi:hypothetical protein
MLSIGDVVNWFISAHMASIDNLERYITGDYLPCYRCKNKRDPWRIAFETTKGILMTDPFNLNDHGIMLAEIHRNLRPSALYEHAINFVPHEGDVSAEVKFGGPV